MKRILINTLLAIGSAYMCAGGLKAQSFQMVANVPFSFEAAGTNHEPGRYSITRPQPTPIVLLRNVAESNSLMLGMASNTETGTGGPARLVFHRYGNKYFLAEIWSADRFGKKLPISSSEREIRSESNTKVASVIVPCRQTE